MRTVLVGLALVASIAPATAQRLLEMERSFRLTGGRCHSLSYSRDGALLASGGEAGEVLVRDVATGELVHRLAAGRDWIGRVRFSHDGRRLAVAGDALRVFDLADGTQLHESRCANPRALDWSGDGGRICVLRQKGRAELLHGETFEVVRGLPLGERVMADAVAFDRSSKHLAVATRRNETLVFDADSGELRERVPQRGWIHDVTWLADGRLLRLGWRGTLFGLGASRALGAFGVSVDASADGKHVLVRNGEDLLRIVDGGEPEVLGFSGPLALCGNGRDWARVVGGQIELRRDGELVRHLRNLHSKQPTAAVLTGDGRFVALAPSFQGGGIEIFEVATGVRLDVPMVPGDFTLLENRGGIELAVMRAIVTEGDRERRELQLWKVSGGRRPRLLPVRTIPFETEVRSRDGTREWPRLSPDHRFLSWGDQVVDLLDAQRTWSANDSEVVRQFGDGFVVATHLLAGELEGYKVVHLGHSLALQSDVEVVDPSGGSVGAIRERGPATGVAVAPAGKRVAVTHEDVLVVGSLPGLVEVARVPCTLRHVRWIDDRHLLGVDGEHRLAVLDSNGGRWLATLPLGSLVRHVDYRPEHGIAVVTLEDRAVLVRVRSPR